MNKPANFLIKLSDKIKRVAIKCPDVGHITDEMFL
jgi:hypothetical protein